MKKKWMQQKKNSIFNGKQNAIVTKTNEKIVFFEMWIQQEKNHKQRKCFAKIFSAFVFREKRRTKNCTHDYYENSTVKSVGEYSLSTRWSPNTFYIEHLIRRGHSTILNVYISCGGFELVIYHFPNKWQKIWPTQWRKLENSKKNVVKFNIRKREKRTPVKR